MFIFNKIVGYCLSPNTLGVLLGVFGLFIHKKMPWKKAGRTACVFSIAWLYIWSTPLLTGFLGLSLEREWKVVKAEDMPRADMIVLLGGGVTAPQNEFYPYSDLKNGADRAWYAAKLWKAGKAPAIIVSNRGAEKCDNLLLMDLGVPVTNIILECEATTTEENALFVDKLLCLTFNLQPSTSARPAVLLVTSAYHMRRSVLMFEKYAPGVRIVPAPCDFEITAGIQSYNDLFCLRGLLPDAGSAAASYCFFKEYLGYFGYKYFRR